MGFVHTTICVPPHPLAASPHPQRTALRAPVPQGLTVREAEALLRAAQSHEAVTLNMISKPSVVEQHSTAHHGTSFNGTAKHSTLFSMYKYK